jgi:N-acetyl-anhydromuramyl-L-alanine amidase AmpD
LGVGPTIASQICKRYDINPREIVGHNECKKCELTK